MVNCNRLKYLFTPSLAKSFPQLTSLQIGDCDWLEEIIEMNEQISIASSSSEGHIQPISFPSLERILIYGCNKLKSLFPISVTHSLSKLTHIEIFWASKLEQLFGYQGEVNVECDPKVIVFPKLIYFRLLELPSLTSFAPTGYYLRFPSLNNVSVRGCPKLTGFRKFNPANVHAITQGTQPTFFFFAYAYYFVLDLVFIRG